MQSPRWSGSDLLTGPAAKPPHHAAAGGSVSGLGSVCWRRHFRFLALLPLIGASSLLLLTACMKSLPPKAPAAGLRDINAVLADHDRELLAIPGVVGVYVGLSDRQEQCLKVMLARKDRKLERSIPRTLEGYSVVTEVTGPIRPLKP
jgi:hypothetical protein